MAAKAIVGVQVPPDSSGKITGAFEFQLQDGTNIYIPVTALVDTNGNEIGGQILQTLQSIEQSLEKIAEDQEVIRHVLGG